MDLLAYPCWDKCSICFICCGQKLVKIEVGSGINGVNTSVIRVRSVGVSLQRVQDRGQVRICGLPFCEQITVTWNFLQQWTESNIDKGIVKIWGNVEGCSKHLSVKWQQIRYFHFIRHMALFFLSGEANWLVCLLSIIIKGTFFSSKYWRDKTSIFFFIVIRFLLKVYLLFVQQMVHDCCYVTEAHQLQ